MPFTSAFTRRRSQLSTWRKEGIAADYDAEGRLAGIEILDAMKRLGDPTVFKRVTLEDVAIAH